MNVGLYSFRIAFLSYSAVVVPKEEQRAFTPLPPRENESFFISTLELRAAELDVALHFLEISQVL